MNLEQSYVVPKLDHGTVIDHLRASTALRCLQVLDLLLACGQVNVEDLDALALVLPRVTRPGSKTGPHAGPVAAVPAPMEPGAVAVPTPGAPPAAASPASSPG